MRSFLLAALLVIVLATGCSSSSPSDDCIRPGIRSGVTGCE